MRGLDHFKAEVGGMAVLGILGNLEDSLSPLTESSHRVPLPLVFPEIFLSAYSIETTTDHKVKLLTWSICCSKCFDE